MEENSCGTGADFEESEACSSSEDGSFNSEVDIAEERPEDQPPASLPKLLPRDHETHIKGRCDVDEDAPPECDYQLVERPPYKFADGTIYKGQWCGGTPMGEGLKIFPDGRKYHGEIHGGKAHGTGSGFLSDGTKYVGPWVEDIPHGSGGFRAMHDGAFYFGEFVNGVEHGQGSLTMSDSSTFVGQFNSGLKDGKGQAVYKALQMTAVNAGSENKIKGYFQTGSYEGEFAKDNYHGHGIFEWVDGRRYEGQWQMNAMHGHGKYTFKDGRKYEGQYKNGEKSGIGTYEWPDGRVYVGQVLRGAQHGRGVYTNARGKSQEGIWHLGRPASGSKNAQGREGELESDF